MKPFARFFALPFTALLMSCSLNLGTPSSQSAELSSLASESVYSTSFESLVSSSAAVVSSAASQSSQSPERSYVQSDSVFSSDEPSSSSPVILSSSTEESSSFAVSGSDSSCVSESSAIVTSSAASSQSEESSSSASSSLNSSSESSVSSAEPFSSVVSSSSESSSEVSSSQESSSSSQASSIAGFDISSKDGSFSISGSTVTITAAGTYKVSGVLEGMILVDAGDDDEVEIDLKDVDISCSENSPIFIANANEVKIKAVKGTTNTITDKRALKTEDDDAQGEGAIYATCDVKLVGTGKLTVTGSYNNGIHGKDDVELKNQTLTVSAPHHAVRGGDGIVIEEGGTFTLISSGGDGLHTANSGLTSKGKQKGDIVITAGDVSIYSATDGIDAAHDVVISAGLDDDNNETHPKLDIKTNKYSDYTGTIYDTAESTLYLRTTTANSSSYRYAFYFYDGDGDGVFADATYKTQMQVSSGRRWTTYHYYEASVPSGYSSFKVYRFLSSASDSTSSYVAVSSGMTLNTSYDTLTVSVNGSTISAQNWSNYSAASSGGFGPGGGPGGMGEQGNADKAETSAKGIKADNLIAVSDGEIKIQAYDDGLHANYGASLENGSTGLGDIEISGGTLNIAASDDGIHADRYLKISGGTLNVSGYEGLEGNQIIVSGGETYVYGTDDAVNAASGPLSEIYFKATGGYLFAEVPSNGDVDGIDSNGNIYIQGGTVISSGPNMGMASPLDCDGSAKVTGGNLILVGRPEATPSTSGVTSSTLSGVSLAAGRSYTIALVNGTVKTGTFQYAHSPSTMYGYCELGKLSSVN